MSSTEIYISVIKILTGGDGFYARELVKVNPSTTKLDDSKDNVFRVAYFEDEVV